MAPPARQASAGAANFADQAKDRVVKLVHNAFLEGNDGVVGDVNALGADFRAAFRDVAEADAERFFQERSARSGVERMHFESGDANEKSGAAVFAVFRVIAKDVADVLAEETFDALAKFLSAVNVVLGHFPLNVRGRRERGDFFVHRIIPGNVCDEILDDRKRLHRRNGDGLILGQGIHARLAGEARTAIDFGGAGAATASFAVPADGKIGSEMALNVMESVENDHARSDRDAIIHGFAAIAVATENG